MPADDAARSHGTVSTTGVRMGAGLHAARRCALPAQPAPWRMQIARSGGGGGVATATSGQGRWARKQDRQAPANSATVSNLLPPWRRQDGTVRSCQWEAMWLVMHGPAMTATFAQAGQLHGWCSRAPGLHARANPPLAQGGSDVVVSSMSRTPTSAQLKIHKVIQNGRYRQWSPADYHDRSRATPTSEQPRSSRWFPHARGGCRTVVYQSCAAQVASPGAHLAQEPAEVAGRPRCTAAWWSWPVVVVVVGISSAVTNPLRNVVVVHFYRRRVVERRRAVVPGGVLSFSKQPLAGSLRRRTAFAVSMQPLKFGSFGFPASPPSGSAGTLFSVLAALLLAGATPALIDRGRVDRRDISAHTRR